MGAPIHPIVSFGKGTVTMLHGSERVIPLEPQSLDALGRAFAHLGQAIGAGGPALSTVCEYCASSVTGTRCESCGAPVRKQGKADSQHPYPLPPLPPLRRLGGPPENIDELWVVPLMGLAVLSTLALAWWW